MEGLVMFANAFQDKSIWVSGSTGFKGSWLCAWLLRLGARVNGYALAPSTSPALYEALGLARQIQQRLGDVRDAAAVADSVNEAQPDFAFHLAAQPLVRSSYENPTYTYDVNVMGTLHVLEALRSIRKPCAAVIVTTDKCYENREWVHGYRECDSLGGHDPYSSSKAAVEIAVASWRRSFFAGHPVRIATARAGNVIGGGDWAQDRIIPDCVRALARGESIPIRNPGSTRPWQHVLEPLSGYLWLAACLSHSQGPDLESAFNFGPEGESCRSVRELVEEMLKHWSGRWEDKSQAKAVHEAGQLNLAIDKARALLKWSPSWSFAEATEQTVAWYRQVGATPDPAAAQAFTVGQIDKYADSARRLRRPWAAEGKVLFA
jgi:CDP-glucose 4,6-dehydratase